MVGEDCRDPVVEARILRPFLSYWVPPFELGLGRLCLAGLLREKLDVVAQAVVDVP